MASSYAERNEACDLRAAPGERRLEALSGGNIQRVMLVRALGTMHPDGRRRTPNLIVAAYPTRGLDIATTRRTQVLLLQRRAEGCGVLLISEDLDEVVALADRVQAIYKGRLSPPVATDEIDAKAIGLMMAGMWEE